MKKKIKELKYVNVAKHASYGIGFGPTVSCKYILSQLPNQ